MPEKNCIKYYIYIFSFFFYWSSETVLYKSYNVYFPVHYACTYSRPSYPPGTIYTFPHVLHNFVVYRTQNDVASLSLGCIIAHTVGARKPSKTYSMTTTISRNVMCSGSIRRHTTFGCLRPSSGVVHWHVS